MLSEDCFMELCCPARVSAVSQTRITMSSGHHLFHIALPCSQCSSRLPSVRPVPLSLYLHSCISPYFLGMSKDNSKPSASEMSGEKSGSHERLKARRGTVQWREATQSKLVSVSTSDLVMVGFFHSQWGEEKLSRVWFMWPTLGIRFGMRWITPLAPLTVYWWDVCLLYERSFGWLA